MIPRIIGSIALVIVWGLFGSVLFPVRTIVAGNLAGMQFANSDVQSVVSQTGMAYVNSMHLPSIILLVLLGLIWWKPVSNLFKSGGSGTAAVIAILAVGAGLMASPAYAYYDKNDYTEAYTILPNESAFWIPDTGANKDSQVQMQSVAYLQANKVAMKRFVVPHTHLQGSGSWFDFYVPAGRLIIVDRTTFSREWVASTNRGTSVKDESFPCQSKEGLDITVGVSVGASVTEDNAATYLYNFGVLPPPGNRNEPAIIFTSVYYSRKLADVMDDVGRKKVQTLVCQQLSSRSFDKDNEEANQIMDIVSKAATDYFASVGITLNFIGWADTFTFDKNVQDAVNRRYIASQDQAIAIALQPYTSTIQALAAADALRSFGQKSDGKLPTTIVGLPPEAGALLSTLLKSGQAGLNAISPPEPAPAHHP